MNYYQDLVGTVFRVLSRQRQPDVLALLPQMPADRKEDERGSGGHFTIPAEVLPSGADVRTLPLGEGFIDAASAAVAKSPAACIFMAPPLLGLPSYSPEFRARFRPLGLTEAAVRQIVEGGTAEPGDFDLWYQPEGGDKVTVHDGDTVTVSRGDRKSVV